MRKHGSVVSLFQAVAIPGAAILAVAMAAWMAVRVHPVEAAGDSLVVIVNPANPVDNLSLAELKKLFLSDRSRWDTGKAVAPVMLTAGAPERTSFLKIVCGMSDADMSKYFLQAAFTGKSATPPKEVSSASAVKSFVAGSPGGIGFVKTDELPAGDTTVKAVKVDGAAASDPGYKLKM
jgi:ABC-type phosphate transport system substrate-binding protein